MKKNNFKNITIFIFVCITSALLFSNFLIAKNNSDKFPSKTKYDLGNYTIEDPEQDTPIVIKEIKASNFINDEVGNNYEIENVLSSSWDKTWCVHGEGIGEWIFIKIPETDPLGVQKGLINLYRINLTNGLVITSDYISKYNNEMPYNTAIKEIEKTFNRELYLANNRVKTLEVEFSGGQKYLMHLDDDQLFMQRFTFNIQAKWVKFTIKEIYKGNKYNDTCISKMRFETMWPISN